VALNLPPASPRYSRTNENQARRAIESAFADVYARLSQAEESLASLPGGQEPVGPTAGFTFVKTDLVVDFTDATVEGDAAVTAHDWDFGDGATSTAASPTHTYPDTGSYLVTLTVTDANDLQDTTQQSVSVVKPAPGGNPVTFVARGVQSVGQIESLYPYWNGAHLANLSPSNCQSVIQGFADAGMKVNLRLWTDAQSKDASGTFNIDNWKTSVDRYLPHRDFLNAMGRAGVIMSHLIMDDIKAGHRWGRPITNAEVEEMAQYSKQFYPDLETNVRARTTQLSGFSFNFLESCGSIYLFNRGGVPEQGRIADCTAYRDAELAAGATLGVKVNFGMNITNGGDSTSGQVGENPGSNANWRMSAQELRDYADILVPANNQSNGWFDQWEWNSGSGMANYLADPAIEASQEYIRALCDAQ
jgi:PKD repeat protein